MLGDVHGEFRYLHRALQDAPTSPRWLVFAGDVDIDTQPFQHYMAPFRQQRPTLKVAFIHGNHDADTHEHWACLHDFGDATPLHNRVANLDGVRVAGLCEVFHGHHHDDCTDAYWLLWPSMGFETYALGSCGIRTASGG